MSQNEAPYAGSSDPFVIPRDATYRASSSDQEFVEDRGLNEDSVAAMTGDEAKQYLKLLLEVLRPDLPSLSWLRRAASAKSTPIQASSPGGPALDPVRKLLLEGRPPISYPL